MKKKIKEKEKGNNITLTPTGNIVVLIDILESKAPLEFRINDPNTSSDILNMIVKFMGPTMPIKHYTKEEEERLSEYVRRPIAEE